MIASEIWRALTRAPRLVTAVIPAFNSGTTTIVRAVESVLHQTYRPIEIVVVDDCSTDNTAEIVEGYAAQGVQLLRLDRQRGASGARNEESRRHVAT